MTWSKDLFSQKDNLGLSSPRFIDYNWLLFYLSGILGNRFKETTIDRLLLLQYVSKRLLEILCLIKFRSDFISGFISWKWRCLVVSNWPETFYTSIWGSLVINHEPKYTKPVLPVLRQLDLCFIDCQERHLLNTRRIQK